jgi:hypothetical protein
MSQPQDILLADGLKPSAFELVADTDTRVPTSVRDNSAAKELLLFGSSKDSLLVVYFAPLKVELYQEGVLTISANTLNFMHFEEKHDVSTHRALEAAAESEEDRHGGKEVVDYGKTIAYLSLLLSSLTIIPDSHYLQARMVWLFTLTELVRKRKKPRLTLVVNCLIGRNRLEGTLTPNLRDQCL